LIALHQEERERERVIQYRIGLIYNTLQQTWDLLVSLDFHIKRYIDLVPSETENLHFLRVTFNKKVSETWYVIHTKGFRV
jgi:hypothetical protein